MALAKKILVAEDDGKLQLLLRTTLSDAGFEIVEASDGEEAVRLASSEKPDLILLDIGMPKMNGYEVCRQIRLDKDPKVSKVKIVVISVKSYPVDIRSAKDVGVDEYLVKPFTIKQLRECVGRHLGGVI